MEEGYHEVVKHMFVQSLQVVCLHFILLSRSLMVETAVDLPSLLLSQHHFQADLAAVVELGCKIRT